MTKRRSNSTKKALYTNILCLILCIAMLIGTTFAWFTDSVSSGKNTITAGNLDVKLQYYKPSDVNTSISLANATWADVGTDDELFDKKALWEPGHAEVVYLKVSNVGTLALKYSLGVSVWTETPGENVNGKKFNLSKYLKFGIKEVSNTYTKRTDAIEAVDSSSYKLSDGYSEDNIQLDPKGGTNDSKIVALVVYMPENVGNEANYKTSTTAPTIDMGVKLLATQASYEKDSFGKDYDDNANGTPDNANYGVITKTQITEQVEANGATTLSNSNVTAIVPKEAVKDKETELTLTVENKGDKGASNISLTDGQTKTVYDISIAGVNTDSNNSIITVVLNNVGTNLKNPRVYHTAKEMTEFTSTQDNPQAEGFYYDSTDGKLYIYTKSFSEYALVQGSTVTVSDANSFNKFIKDADSGSTIKLTQDITIDSADISKNLKLDLGSSTLTINSALTVSDKLTITGNGTLKSCKKYISVTGSKAVVTVESGTIESLNDYLFYASYGGSVIVNGGVLNSKYAPLAGNNTTGNMNFTVNGGTITATEGPAIYMPGQINLIITNGTLNGGISLRMGNVKISGGTINAITNNIDSIEQYYNYSGNAFLPDALFIMGGTYTSSDSRGNQLDVVITGGTFNCTNGVGKGFVYYDLGKVDQKVNITITGSNLTSETAVVKKFSDIGVENPEYGVNPATITLKGVMETTSN